MPVGEVRGQPEGAARSYLAVCGTDRDSDIGSQHDCDCRSQFNSESTVKGEGRGEEGVQEGGVKRHHSLYCLGDAADGTMFQHPHQPLQNRTVDTQVKQRW